MGPCFPCNFVGALRPIGEVVSQAKFGCNVNNVRHPVCMCHLDQLGVRWGCLSLALIVLGHIAIRCCFSASSLARLKSHEQPPSAFVISHADESAMPQVPGIRPFNKSDLADQLRLDPAALVHFLCG